MAVTAVVHKHRHQRVINQRIHDLEKAQQQIKKNVKVMERKMAEALRTMNPEWKTDPKEDQVHSLEERLDRLNDHMTALESHLSDFLGSSQNSGINRLSNEQVSK